MKSEESFNYRKLKNKKIILRLKVTEKMQNV